MSEVKHYDVVIVGGGLVGAATALDLSLRGMSVALIERRYCGSQASGVNFGGIRCQGRVEEQMPLAVRARRIWDRLQGLVGTNGEFVVTGHLKLARKDSDYDVLRAWSEMAARYGVESAIIEGSDFRKKYPWLGDAAIGGSVCPTDGQVNPRIVSPAFARAARSAGAEIFEQTELGEVIFDGKLFRAQVTNIGIVTSTWLVNAAGAWANGIAAQFGDEVPMERMYPNMWVTEPLPKFMTRNLGVVGGGFYARQVDRGNVVVGGGRASGDIDYAQPLSKVTIGAMHEACAMLPQLRGSLLIRSWSGVEGETPDHNPIICASSNAPCLLHAFGFSGGGFLLAPGVGEILADLIVDGETKTPIGAFSNLRFNEKRMPVEPSLRLRGP